MCKHTDEAELGIKNLRDFNLELLAKWIWRLKTDTNIRWQRIIQCKYMLGDEGVMSDECLSDYDFKRTTYRVILKDYQNHID